MGLLGLIMLLWGAWLIHVSIKDFKIGIPNGNEIQWFGALAIGVVMLISSLTILF